MNESPDGTEYRRSSGRRAADLPPQSRPSHSAGRRKGDDDPHTTFTRKFLVVIVAAVNGAYLVVELFLRVHHVCP